MQVQFHAHLPGISLAGAEGFTIGPGRLIRLPFEQWHRLDSAFFGSGSNYERSKPVFWAGELETADGTQGGYDALEQFLLRLHQAFLLEPRTPLMSSPVFSVTYVDNGSGSSSWIGWAGREWIVFSERLRYDYDEEQLRDVRANYELLVATDLDSAFAGVAAGLETLELTTRPENLWIGGTLSRVNDFIHCMTACEHILLPPKQEQPPGMKLTPTFGRNAATLTALSREEMRERARSFSDLYRLRSRLIHGEHGITNLDESARSRLRLGRQLLRASILAGLTMGAGCRRGSTTTLPRLLAEAYQDADAHRTLLDDLQKQWRQHAHLSAIPVEPPPRVPKATSASSSQGHTPPTGPTSTSTNRKNKRKKNNSDRNEKKRKEKKTERKKKNKSLALYLPLWGASFDSDGVGWVATPRSPGHGSPTPASPFGGHVMVYVPYLDEWLDIQKTALWHEQMDAASGLLTPPVCLCLVVDERSRDGEEMVVINRLGEGMVRAGRDAVTVLRLFKAGWFLDPQLAESTFVRGSLRERRVGPYRQAFLDPQEATAFAEPLLPYSLHIAELTTLQDGPGPITTIWSLLEAYRSNGSNHASVDIALENFNRSFGLQLSDVQRVMYLFTALDAMLGGMSAREIGNVRLKASFQARVQAAFDAAGAALQPFDPEEAARWLDSAGRGMRNAIAHGRPASISAEAQAGQKQLHHIIRVLARQYLEFSVRFVAGGSDIERRLQLPHRCPLTSAYNKVLEARALGVDEAADLLGP